MASVTLLVLLAILHLSSLGSTVHWRRNQGHNAIRTSNSPVEYSGKSDPQCQEDIQKRSADCRELNLTKVPDYLSPDIQKLSLWYNRIRSLYNSSFLKYPELTTLVLSSNDIHVIESGTFLPLKHLQNLNIYGNSQLTSLPDNITYSEQFVRLSVLRLSSNELTHVNIACSPGSQGAIEKISLSGNNLGELTSETLKLNCDINILDLSDNPVIRIDPETIATLRVQTLRFGWKYVISEVWIDLLIGVARSRIKWLQIENVDKDITVDFFRPLYNSPLTSLELNSVHLNFQNATPFSNLNQLIELTIENTDIPTLEPEYFLGMNRLEILHLENNHINQINPYDSIWSTTQVREIHLGFNDLKFLSHTAFQGLDNLSALDLSYNMNFMELVINQYTGGLFNLHYLNVSNNAIEEFSVDAPFVISLTSSASGDYFKSGITFQDTPSLQWLDLSDSNIRSHHIWNSLTSTSLFDGLDNLAHLLLEGNHISELLQGMFRGLFALEFLDLSNCEVSSIQSNAFRGLSSLRSLSLGGNKIQRLPFNLLTDLKALLTYNLADNDLDFLDSRTFANTTSLQTLVLAGNKFTYFNDSTFEPLMFALVSIDVSQNQLICNCDMSWLVKWLDGQLNVLNDDNTVCSTASATLSPLRGKPLLTFIPSDLCGPNIVLICSTSLVVIVFAATLFLIYHFRWFVRYKLYLLKLAVIGYNEIIDARDHGDFEFDLNIMFMEDDEQWVQEHLRPVLEERLPNFNRNAIGDDDLILGMHYLDAVFYVIEKSFKTVLLLSRAAFQDNWFMNKFRIAFDQVNDARMENIVVVFLEDIQDAELPFLVRLYLSERRTYLWWVEDERGQEYFWNELILTLQRDNMRCNIMIPPE